MHVDSMKVTIKNGFGQLLWLQVNQSNTQDLQYHQMKLSKTLKLFPVSYVLTTRGLDQASLRRGVVRPGEVQGIRILKAMKLTSKDPRCRLPKNPQKLFRLKPPPNLQQR
jgi:hypothetical protein